MEKLGNILIENKMVDLDNTNVNQLESYLQSIQNRKEMLKEKLDEILEEIYN